MKDYSTNIVVSVFTREMIAFLESIPKESWTVHVPIPDYVDIDVMGSVTPHRLVTKYDYPELWLRNKEDVTMFLLAFSSEVISINEPIKQL